MKSPSTIEQDVIKAAATDWWIKLDSDWIKAEDRDEFARWLAADARHGAAFESVRNLWSELAAIQDRIEAPANRTKSFPLWQWAAPAMAMACLVLWLFSPLSVLLDSDYRTGLGERQDIHLSDGSTVHLNSDSALAVRINGQQRQLALLQGEAWFEVNPDPSRPFRVRAGQGTITALGTSFNIRLLNGRSEVSVTRHSVAVDVDREHGRVFHAVVNEGQQVDFDPQAGISGARAIDSQVVTAWQRGHLVFQNRPLGEVIAELNRYHRGLLLVTDSTLTQRRVNGVFRTDQPLAVLTALETSLQLRSTHISNYLILLHR